MSYEVRIGLLAAICIAITIWGYKFMLGKNLLNASNIYYVEYHNVDELTPTSPILIRGLRVGTVREVQLEDNMTSITVTLDIDNDIKLPKSTVATIVSMGIMGGKAVILHVNSACSGDDCAKSGDYLQGDVKGFFANMLGGSDANEYIDKIKQGLGDFVSDLGDSLSNSDADIARTFRDLQVIIESLAGITTQLNSSMSTYDRQAKSVLGNIETLTGALAENSAQISATLSNLETITRDLKEADVAGKTVHTMESADATLQSMQEAVVQTKDAVNSLQAILSGVEDGKGTLGKLANDPDLYENLNSMSQNLDLLLQDLRLNPKRYINVSVFGKKQKEYTVPEDDPANQ